MGLIYIASLSQAISIHIFVRTHLNISRTINSILTKQVAEAIS